eukprot:TRINITY_DN4835_c0_g1_i1.p1 TRINITY_DN4835_c0_g1~~TRINITY_DN4835_c0_g1_i1.p1  ORF type:complete len:58 (-),score=1.92 TRINITY_DN4835_c0_g1_i1:103-276(-)
MSFNCSEIDTISSCPFPCFCLLAKPTMVDTTTIKAITSVTALATNKPYSYKNSKLYS